MGMRSKPEDRQNLASFWQTVLATLYADSAAPYGVVRLVDDESEIVAAYLFTDVGRMPMFAHYQPVDGHWLVTLLQLRIECHELPPEVRAEVIVETCPR